MVSADEIGARVTARMKPASPSWGLVVACGEALLEDLLAAFNG